MVVTLKKISVIPFSLIIICFAGYIKNLIDFTIFSDAYNKFPDMWFEGDFWFNTEPILIYIAIVLIIFTFINIFNIPAKFSKTINIFVVIFSSIFCFISSILVLNALTYLSEANISIYNINGGIMGFIISLMVIIFALATALISL